MFGSKVKLDRDLLRRVKRYSDIAGYSSVEEFITHALEKEIALLEDAETVTLTLGSVTAGDADVAIDGVLRQRAPVLDDWIDRVGIASDTWRGLAEGQDHQLVAFPAPTLTGNLRLPRMPLRRQRLSSLLAPRNAPVDQ